MGLPINQQGRSLYKMDQLQYKAYNLRNFENIPQMRYLTEADKKAINIVGSVLPFKVNNYVVNELINWDDYENDPIYKLTFPQREMLDQENFHLVADLIKKGNQQELKKEINAIRLQLNPHPAGQLNNNVPEIDGVKLTGIQHKYRETLLFFPSQGQTCHAYCTFCFRWPQFIGIEELKFASKEVELLIEYLKRNTYITDVLFTGGDPMIMKTKVLESYILPLLESDLSHLRTIRIGTKALSYWPYRFLSDKDADEMLDLFCKIKDSGKHLAFMAHFNHPNELNTQAVQLAIERILETGAQIRTQSPILRHINDNALDWAEMWRKQVDLGCIPYYMFQARDTGAQSYFGVPLVKSWEIFSEAYRNVSGICRTVRGPSMSADPGKIQISGITEVNNEKVIALIFLQGRNPEWVKRPFFAEYDEEAIWIDELKPAFGEENFFFENEFDSLVENFTSNSDWSSFIDE
jgi:KamA family protein